jgi:hypothetical protein
MYEMCQVTVVLYGLTYLSFLKYRFDGFRSLSMCSRSYIFISEITVIPMPFLFPIISYVFVFNGLSSMLPTLFIPSSESIPVRPLPLVLAQSRSQSSSRTQPHQRQWSLLKSHAWRLRPFLRSRAWRRYAHPNPVPHLSSLVYICPPPPGTSSRSPGKEDGVQEQLPCIFRTGMSWL